MKGITKKAADEIEQSLKDSELRYRRLFEAAQDGILILDAETGKIENVNPYLVNLLGYSRAEFLEKKLWEVGAFKDIEASKESFEVLQEKEYVRYEDLPLRAKDGQLVQVEFVSNLYLVDDEKVIQCNIRDTTEHRRIIAALTHNEMTYHNLINQSPDGFFVIASSGKILSVNKAICQALNFSQEELLSMNVWDIIPNTYLEKHKKRLIKVLSGMSLNEEVEYKIQGKDGQLHFVEIISAPHYSGKDIVGFQGIARDITARKRTQEALNESEKRYRLLVESLPDGVVIHSQGRTIFANPASAKIIGAVSPDDLIGKPTMEFVHPDYRKLSLKRIQQALTEGVPDLLAEEKFVRQDGTAIDVEVSVIPISYDDTPAVLSVFNDITERKQAEEEIRASEAKFREYIDSAPLGLFVADQSGRYVEVNKAACVMLGYTEPELLLLSIPDILAPQSLDDGLHQFQKVVQEGSVTAEFLFRRKDGTQFWATVLAVKLSENRFMSYCQDITENKQHQREMEAIANVSLALRDASTRDDMISIILSQVVEILDSAGSAYVKFDPLTKTYIAELGNGVWSDIQSTIIDENGMTDQVVRTKEPYVNNQSETRPDPRDSISEITGLVKAVACTPLIAQGEVIGVLWLGRNTPIDDEALRMLSSIANIAASAIRRTTLYEETVENLHRLEGLNSIETAINTSLDLNLTLRVLVNQVMQLLKVDATNVLLFDEISNTLRFATGKGFGSTIQLRKANIKYGDSYAGRAVLERKTIKVLNLPESLDFHDFRNFVINEDFSSYVGVPLIAKGRVVGVLEVYSCSPLNPGKGWMDFLETLAGQAAIAIDNATLFDDLQRSHLELNLGYDQTIIGWARTLEMRDHETEGHSQRVTELAVSLAQRMGIKDKDLVQIRRGAVLHDIGKMAIPDELLHKPGELTVDEWDIMQQHPVYAYEWLSHIDFLKEALDIPRYHHEKWDGTGYPEGLIGEDIPLSARIFAIVDVWDALLSDRPYRIAWTKQKTLKHIQDQSGKHFDPKVVKSFIKLIKESNDLS